MASSGCCSPARHGATYQPASVPTLPATTALCGGSGHPVDGGRNRQVAETAIPMSYKIEDYAKLVTLYKLIDGVNVDSPEPKQDDQVRADLLAAITDARSGQRDLSHRLKSQCAQKKNRSTTVAVRQRLAAEWHSS